MYSNASFCLGRVFVPCSQLALEKASTIRQALLSYISEALDHAPSLVVLDDLDSIVSSSSDSEGSQASTSVLALTEFLIDIMDEYWVNTIGTVPRMLAIMLMLKCYLLTF